jgi:long-chain acyl-CoA synthetase
VRLGYLIDRAAALAAATPAAADAEGETRSWAALRDDVLAMAAALAALGVGRGTPVAVLALNAARWLDTCFALWRLGAVVVPLNMRLAPAELVAQLRDSGARLLLCDRTLAPLAAQLDGPAGVRVQAWDALPFGTAPVPADAGAGGEDLAAIFYTGGSTGRPKGVLLSHAALSLAALTAVVEAISAPRGAVLHVAPMFHLSGAVALVSAVQQRLPGIFVARFDPGLVLRLVAQHRPTSLVVAPIMLQMFLDHPDFARTDLSSLETLVYGSAPMPEPLLHRAIRALPPTTGFVQGYGMTEAAGAVSLLKREDHDPDAPHPERLRSAGRPTLFAELRVVNVQSQDLPAGEIGEVIVRTPTLMRGYLGQPAETARALRDGWYHTGDAGYLDAHGYLYIVDRLKDMIVSGGENVYCAEVEAALCSHPDVAQAAVFGIPHETYGEAVHAEIVPVPGSRPDVEALIAHCRARIAGYKLPRSIVLRTEPLPMSAAGKVQKNVLRAPFWSGRDRQVN